MDEYKPEAKNMEKKIKYAIGDQNFRSLREGGCVYIDKTSYDLLTQQPLALLYQTGYLTIKEYNPKIIRIEVNFSSETRCIEDWKIEKM